MGGWELVSNRCCLPCLSRVVFEIFLPRFLVVRKISPVLQSVQTLRQTWIFRFFDIDEMHVNDRDRGGPHDNDAEPLMSNKAGCPILLSPDGRSVRSGHALLRHERPFVWAALFWTSAGQPLARSWTRPHNHQRVGSVVINLWF